MAYYQTPEEDSKMSSMPIGNGRVSAETVPAQKADLYDDALPAPAVYKDEPTSWSTHFRRFFRFVGPTWLIAVTFTDPGGLTGAFQSGSETRYRLIWITWWSLIFAYVFQILAARVGIVTGRHLGAMIRERYGDGFVKYVIWAFIQGGVLGDDIQACVAATIALRIMTSLPWWACVLLTVVVSTVLTIAYYWSITGLEICIGTMLLGMLILICVCAGYGHGDTAEIIKGWVIPKVPSGQVLTVVGNVGGVLTPEAIYLGTAMVLSRPVNRSSRKNMKQCLVYSMVELLFGMLVAFFVIFTTTITFANGFYTEECSAQGLAFVPSKGGCDEIGLADGPDALKFLYGEAAKWIFAIVLLLSGITSIVSNTIGGQASWEGFHGKKVAFWKVMLVTRCVAIIPTMTLALTIGNKDVAYTVMNDWINIYMSLAMPMAVIPVTDIAASKRFMGDLAIKPLRIVVSAFLILALIGINFYLMAEFLFNPINFGSQGDFPTSSTFYAGVGACWLAYGYVLWKMAVPGMWDMLVYCAAYVYPNGLPEILKQTPC